jgi:hypothetical protein
MRNIIAAHQQFRYDSVMTGEVLMRQFESNKVVEFFPTKIIKKLIKKPD